MSYGENIVRGWMRSKGGKNEGIMERWNNGIRGERIQISNSVVTRVEIGNFIMRVAGFPGTQPASCYSSGNS